MYDYDEIPGFSSHSGNTMKTPWTDQIWCETADRSSNAHATLLLISANPRWRTAAILKTTLSNGSPDRREI